MFCLKLYKTGYLPYREDLDLFPLSATFRSYLDHGWLRGAAGQRLLWKLVRGCWDETDGEFWHGEDGIHPAAELPNEVKFALTLAENARRHLWTTLPREPKLDPERMMPVWQVLAEEPQDLPLALRFYDESDCGLLQVLQQNQLPLEVTLGGRRRRGTVEEVFRALFRMPSPMALLRQVKQLRRTLYPGWDEDGAPFVPRRAAELGYGDWTFHNRLVAEPYCMDESPLLHSRVPTCLTVTRHADGSWTMDYPIPDTLLCPGLPPDVNGYDELMALCGEGLAPGDHRWALVCDREFSPRIPLESPCFGFVFDEAARTLELTEQENALHRMQDALTGLLRYTAAHKEEKVP